MTKIIYDLILFMVFFVTKTVCDIFEFPCFQIMCGCVYMWMCVLVHVKKQLLNTLEL